ncbi:MAG: dihydrodipicolinate synthase family protein, partial [Rhizobiales bacterium]|nr:dihydrodipicolinate synthase family protein [Hyphomicrobiales bacterium]
MSRFKNYSPRGVIPATLLAFNDDYSINDKETARHLRHVAAVQGLNAITVNGHASEVHACTFEEQQHILAVSMAEVGDKIPLINGVYADGTLEAVRIA